MENTSYIYEMHTVPENRQLDEDIISGIGFDILISMMEGKQTAGEIAEYISVPKNTVQSYLRKMMNAGIVLRCECGSTIDTEYQLSAKNVQLMSRIREQKDDHQKKRMVEVVSHYYAMMLKKMLKTSFANENKPSKVQAYFIRTEEKDMMQFKKELDELFQKYKMLENEEGKETYSLLAVLSPFDINEQ